MRLVRDKLKLGSAVLSDFFGALMVAVCLAGSIWYSFLRPDDASARIPRVAAATAQLSERLTKARFEIDRRSVDEQALRRRIEALGGLPVNASVETELRRLADMAVRYGLRISAMDPHSVARYGEVTEERHELTLVGSFFGISEFLAEIEASKIWADITYLSIERSKPARLRDGVVESETCQARLIISFFSAPESHGSAKEGSEP